MKYLAIGVHGAVDVTAARDIAPRSAEWIAQGLANEFLECAYSMAGGGRLLIAEAASADALLEELRAAPDVERQWQITELSDARESIARFLDSIE